MGIHMAPNYAWEPLDPNEPSPWQQADRQAIAGLAAPMVPALLARWEARIGQGFGPYNAADAATFAVAEARVLARMLLGPPDERLEGTLRDVILSQIRHRESSDSGATDQARNGEAARGGDLNSAAQGGAGDTTGAAEGRLGNGPGAL